MVLATRLRKDPEIRVDSIWVIRLPDPNGLRRSLSWATKSAWLSRSLESAALPVIVSVCVRSPPQMLHTVAQAAAYERQSRDFTTSTNLTRREGVECECCARSGTSLRRASVGSAQLGEERCHARALFASMSHREFDTFSRSLAGLIDRLRVHLAATGGQL